MKIENKKNTLALAGCLILLAILSVKVYMLVDALTCQNGTLSEGVVIQDWPALRVIFAEIAVGVCGLLFLITKRVRVGKRNKS